MPYFDNVLADIGDDQSLVQSLSTFSGHIERIKRILMRTTKQSLVLFDEIGSGTDPAEGAALGIALLRYLAGAEGERHAALTFATTHHGELKTLKYGTSVESSLFENASVEFDSERMAPTYRLLWGIPGRSNALAIARRLGLHSGVVSLAEELMSGGDMGEGRVNVSKMIADLESEKKAAEEARSETVAAWAEVDTLRAELQSRLADLRAEEEKLRMENRQALNQQLVEAKKEIGDTIREMQKEGLSSRAAADASLRLDGIRTSSEEAFASSGEDGAKRNTCISVNTIKVGNRVSAPRLGATNAEVVEVDEGRKEVVVLMGAMRARVKVRELTNVSRLQQSAVFNGQAAGSALAKKQAKKELKASRASGGVKKAAVRTSANTIDVRGDRVDEAEAKVDAGISRALMSGRMWIIHGHGTGRLRSGLWSYLTQHTSVEKYVLHYRCRCPCGEHLYRDCGDLLLGWYADCFRRCLNSLFLCNARFEYAPQSDGGTGEREWTPCLRSRNLLTWEWQRCNLY
jgi:DNA mismatch repair protein MutS2